MGQKQRSVPYIVNTWLSRIALVLNTFPLGLIKGRLYVCFLFAVSWKMSLIIVQLCINNEIYHVYKNIILLGFLYQRKLSLPLFYQLHDVTEEKTQGHQVWQFPVGREPIWVLLISFGSITWFCLFSLFLASLSVH